MNEVYFITPKLVISSKSVAMMELGDTFISMDKSDELVEVRFLFHNELGLTPITTYVNYEDYIKMIHDWKTQTKSVFRIFKNINDDYYNKNDMSDPRFLTMKDLLPPFMKKLEERMKKNQEAKQ